MAFCGVDTPAYWPRAAYLCQVRYHRSRAPGDSVDTPESQSAPPPPPTPYYSSSPIRGWDAELANVTGDPSSGMTVALTIGVGEKSAGTPPAGGPPPFGGPPPNRPPNGEPRPRADSWSASSFDDADRTKASYMRRIRRSNPLFPRRIPFAGNPSSSTSYGSPAITAAYWPRAAYLCQVR